VKKIALIFIFALALFLRVYKLGSCPVGFLWDEAALGYNGYSILKTGRDEYGKFLPIIFKSFGDYKPGLYVYLAVPSIAVFGLNEFSTRLPAAIFGSLTVLLIYFLIKEAFFLTTERDQKFSERLALAIAFLLAVSPWHINFSRGAWEVTIMIFLLMLGFYLILKFLNSKKLVFFLFSIVSLVFSLFAYQASKLLMPVLALAFFYFFRKYFEKIPSKVRGIFILLVFLSSFLFNMFASLEGRGGRLKVMSIFSYPRSPEETQSLISQDKNNKFDWVIFHSSPFYFFRSVLGRYLNHFSGKFLFISGDWSNPRNGILFQGVMYYLDLVFLAAGLIYLARKNRNSLENFMIFWLFFAPVPSALTRDSISSIRSFSMVIPLIFIAGTGAIELFSYLNERKSIFRYGLKLLFVFVYLALFIRLLDLYFIHDKFYNSANRLFGYKEMINFVNSQIVDKNEVVISNKYGQPYIYFLFYSKYDPKSYQKVANLTKNPYGDVGEVERIGKIEFRRVNWPSDRFTRNSLFVGDEFELPVIDIVGQENIYFLKEIKYYNGNTAFRIVETR